MSLSLDTPITWRSVIRIGLVWAAEYAVLGLIEEAPTFVKVATIMCSLGILAVLESEALIKQRWGRHLFTRFISGIVVGYVICCVYALVIAMTKDRIKRHLDELYAASLDIGGDNPAVEGNDVQSAYFKKISTDEETWIKNTKEYLHDNVSIAAVSRFMDGSYLNAPLSWVPQNIRFSPNALRYDVAMARLATCRRNLATIIESGAYLK